MATNSLSANQVFDHVRGEPEWGEVDSANIRPALQNLSASEVRKIAPKSWPTKVNMELYKGSIGSSAEAEGLN